MNKFLIIFLTILPFIAISCDEGKIYPDEQEIASKGMSVTVKGTFTGCAGYENSDFGIVVAAFKEGDDFAVISKPLTDGDDDIELKNIDTSVSTVEICVISRLRERILTIESMAVDVADGPDFTFDAGEMDLSPFSVINHNIFSTSCVQCHGATGTSAAQLNLTPAEAYSNLVNVPSTVIEGEMRVKPGEPAVSSLWEAVATDISETWKFDHSNLLPPEKSGFVEEWINNGAND